MSRSSNENWTTIITSRSGWLDINLKDIWRYRELIFLFVRRDFVATYKQTILGPLWYVLQPLLIMIVYTIVFGLIARLPTDGMPRVLFYLSGIITWNYFSSCLGRTADTFVTNASIFGKVYFPRLTVPISIVITNLISYLIQFSLFILFLFYYYVDGALVKPNIWMLMTPVLIVQLAALGLGIGLIVASLTTKYRDLSYIVGFGMQLWMYATPIIYPLSLIPKKWHWIFIVNPVAPIIESFRYAFLGGTIFEPWHLGLSFLITLVILLSGIILFNRMEKSFMDTI